jgi:predicted enzyme related to lactoylglutathione lyase
LLPAVKRHETATEQQAGKTMTRSPCVHLLPVHALLAAALLAGLLFGCSSKINLPPVTPDAGGLSYTGKFVWYDLHIPDIDGVARFYDAVLDWGMERTDPGSSKVKTIFHKGRLIGSVFELTEAGPAAGWVACASVPDVDGAAARAVKQGGRVVAAPTDKPYRGRMATIRDPQSARLALLHSPVGDPRDEGPGDGLFLGAELWTPDVEAGAKFYAGLLGYQLAAVRLKQGTYVMLLAEGKPRGGLTAPLASLPAALWIPQVAVSDIEGTVQRVEENGGTVLLRPDPASRPNRTAVFADPSGAILGVREFVPPRD